MIVLTRCTDCKVMLEMEPEELCQSIQGAVEWSKNYNGCKDIRIACPACSKKMLSKIQQIMPEIAMIKAALKQ